MNCRHVRPGKKTRYSTLHPIEKESSKNFKQTSEAAQLLLQVMNNLKKQSPKMRNTLNDVSVLVRNELNGANLCTGLPQNRKHCRNAKHEILKRAKAKKIRKNKPKGRGRSRTAVRGKTCRGHCNARNIQQLFDINLITERLRNGNFSKSNISNDTLQLWQRLIKKTNSSITQTTSYPVLLNKNNTERFVFDYETELLGSEETYSGYGSATSTENIPDSKPRSYPQTLAATTSKLSSFTAHVNLPVVQISPSQSDISTMSLSNRQTPLPSNQLIVEHTNSLYSSSAYLKRDQIATSIRYKSEPSVTDTVSASIFPTRNVFGVSSLLTTRLPTPSLTYIKTLTSVTDTAPGIMSTSINYFSSFITTIEASISSPTQNASLAANFSVRRAQNGDLQSLHRNDSKKLLSVMDRLFEDFYGNISSRSNGKDLLEELLTEKSPKESRLQRPKEQSEDISTKDLYPDPDLTRSQRIPRVLGKNFLVKIEIMRDFSNPLENPKTEAYQILKKRTEDAIKSLYRADEEFVSCKVVSFGRVKRDNMTFIDIEMYFTERDNDHLSLLKRQLMEGFLGEKQTSPDLEIELLNDNILDINWCMPPCINPYGCYPQCNANCCGNPPSGSNPQLFRYELAAERKQNYNILESAPINRYESESKLKNFQPLYVVYKYVLPKSLRKQTAGYGDEVLTYKLDEGSGRLICGPYCNREVCVPECHSICCHVS